MTASELARSAEQVRLVTRVARMYHERGVKQPQIAEQLHISQAKVSRLLKRAEQLGIVRVAVFPPPGDLSSVEEQLVARYGLADAVVADTAEVDEREVTAAIGAAAALYLGDILLSHERIGVSSWSATLLAMVSQLGHRPKSVADAVVQVIGGVGNPTAQVQATRLTEELAKLTGGEPRFLNTPGMTTSPGLGQALLKEPYLADVVKEWEQLTVLLAGIGALEPSTLLRQSGNAIPEEEQSALRDAGAVGDLCLRFFDAAGQAVTLYDDHVVGIGREALLKVPRRIGVAGGRRKWKAIKAAVTGGWANVLITDLATAEELLA
ncbi:MAG: helix-turn-helix domain-containing protein [Propionibacteriaceae bacterium]|jgi:DNA-binding transcriptional regulator LsrR (DeoR family)|nr:helix-turn-helix domain-containing protein [Propionibacteriaceae bacterium]